MARERTYIAIDLKSFYASVECMERGLDPMTTNLVVADASRTEKTICLAVSPSLKAHGIPGRARLFEVIQRVQDINARRQQQAPGRTLCGASWDAATLAEHPSMALDYITAPPQMARYLQYSAKIYRVYLKYVAPEDIHVYSIDEVFIDATPYLRAAGQTPRQFAQTLIRDVWQTTCITATAGIGTNLYLCKIALDIMAKHTPPDEFGMRIAELTELSYRELLWDHRPLTDFWRVGRGIARKLEAHGLFTMGDVALCSTVHENLLYKLFGINAELLIDHAWGWEPCTIADIHGYRPATNSLSSGQVLSCPYDFSKARLIVREMLDAMALDLVEKGLVTDQIVLTVGFDRENLSDPARRDAYHGSVVTDPYGRSIPKHAHGTANLGHHTASGKQLTSAGLMLFDRITDPTLLIRRLTIAANHLLPEGAGSSDFRQLDLFSPGPDETAILEREKRQQQAQLTIRRKFGKNAIWKAASLKEGATARERNNQIGGHKA